MNKLAIKHYLERTGFETFRPKAVLFDMDGVLIDSMPNHAVAWQRSMAIFGITMTAADAYATEGARGIDTIRNMVRQQQGKEITLDEAQQMYDEKTHQFGLLPVAPVMPGALELHEKIHRDGILVGIVTGSGQRPLIQRLLTEFPRVTQSRLVTAYDVSRGKPAPDPYLMGMQKCGVKPCETIVVENAPLGVRAAHASQAFTIAVNTGPLPDEALWQAGADIVLPSLQALCDAWHITMPRDERWMRNYLYIKEFMLTNHRRPSKHRAEELVMHHWLKQNKKLLNAGRFPADRLERFNELLALCQQYRRLNQFAYKD